MEIRKAKRADLVEVSRWLKEEEEAGLVSFYCNLNVIRDAFKEGRMYVLSEQTGGKPVAFVADGYLGPSILEVRHELRGKGLGSTFAEFIIEKARSEGRGGLEIECAPESSIPFWKRQGFKLYGNNRAHLLLEKSHILPSEAPEVSVTIGFFPEQVKWEPNVQPVLLSSPRAARVSESAVRLATRTGFIPRGVLEPGRDAVVSIEVDGVLLFKDKAKYPEAKRLGVQYDHVAFFIDELAVPSVR